ncbi:hypothetical protein [Rubrivirga sp.]|uniref:hypothetical protein n=1 Tax=Rubrivirga sp. TaxID=1885344 RepID=UPI003C748695
MLLVHDRSDREVPFEDGGRAGQAATAFWATDGLGHRRILRSDAVIARVVEFLRPLVEPSSMEARVA